MFERSAGRPWNVTSTVRAVAVALVCSVPARAATAAPAANATASVSAAPDAPRVWYRSSDGCPDGAAFITLLGRSGRSVSLAGVGDRVDFVVTLAHAPEQSGGRLERQSSEGTVAIREVTAASCEEVAEVLALSLDLALQPQPGLAQQPARQPTEPTPPPELATEPGWEQRLGAQATIATGLARTVLPGAALSYDLRPAAGAWSGRFSLRGARGKRDAVVGVSVSLLTSRIEGCWVWAFDSVDVAPCLGLDLGLVFAEGSGNTGRSDTGVWSSAGAYTRAGWQLGRSFGLEAQAGLFVPFLRYRFSASEGGDVTSSAPLGFEAALGLSFRL